MVNALRFFSNVCLCCDVYYSRGGAAQPHHLQRRLSVCGIRWQSLAKFAGRPCEICSSGTWSQLRLAATVHESCVPPLRWQSVRAQSARAILSLPRAASCRCMEEEQDCFIWCAFVSAG